ncbi:MAG: hypothetical protein ACRENP_00220 [Longimicrobiales bacterium]
MSLFRPSRKKTGPDRFINAKIAIFCLGAAIASAGIIMKKSWIVNVAIGVLLLGVCLRFLGRDRSPPPTE